MKSRPGKTPKSYQPKPPPEIVERDPGIPLHEWPTLSDWCVARDLYPPWISDLAEEFGVLRHEIWILDRWTRYPRNVCNPLDLEWLATIYRGRGWPRHSEMADEENA